ncbi:MAG TPA: hypothetical protein VFT71_05665 [Candidatus Nitrosocosmicus sp.]|nr:hypothetical protein [Candidatus Nitrosocosmicus sp.]
MDSNIDWIGIVKKEARVHNNLDLGTIQHVSNDSVTVQKGLIDKETYQFPKSLVKDFDGNVLTIKVSENELSHFKIDQYNSPTVRDQYLSTTEIDRGGGSGGGIQIEPTRDNPTSVSDSS